jgi:hypothetical protein
VLSIHVQLLTLMKAILVSLSLALVSSAAFTGCVASVGNQGSPRGGTLGQQLIDLQKAQEAGAITPAEYENQKQRLLRGR